MKKFLCFSILICLVFGTVFAQQRPANPPPAPAQPAKPATPPPAAPAKPAAANSSNEAKNALAIDVFQMLKGFVASDSDDKTFYFNNALSYERLIVPHFSIGGDMDIWFAKAYDIPVFYFSMAAEGRYYPSANFDKFFLGTTLGFNLLSIDGEKAESAYGGFFGLIISLKTGYKIVIKNMYIEPSLAYVLSKTGGGGGGANIGGILGIIFGDGITIPTFDVPTPWGWNPGLRFGFQF
jgi:hypothetical protein